MPRPTKAFLARKAKPARDERQARAARLEEAVKSYHQRIAEGDEYVSIRRVADEWDVIYSTLARRLNGMRSTKEQIQSLQILTPAEESALIDQIVWLQKHGFPPRPDYVKHLVRGMLKEKNSSHELGKDWLQKFCFRHLEMKKTIVSPRDYKRAQQETRQCFQQFYDLFRETVDTFGILDQDI